MAIISARQEAYLLVFEKSYQVYRQAKLTIEARLQAQMDLELGLLRTEASKDGNRAVAEGIPITRLGDKGRNGMSTKSFNTIRTFLDLTKDVFEGEADALAVPRCQWVTTDENQPYLNGGMGMGKVERLHVTMSGPDYDTFVRESLRDKLVHPKRVDVWTDMTEHTFDMLQDGTVGHVGVHGDLYWHALFAFPLEQGADELAEWLESNPHTVYPGNFPEEAVEVAAPKERKTMSFSKVLEEGK